MPRADHTPVHPRDLELQHLLEPEPETVGGNGLMAHGLQEPLLVEWGREVGIADNSPRERIHPGGADGGQTIVPAGNHRSPHPDDGDPDAHPMCKLVDRVLCIGSKRWCACCANGFCSADETQQLSQHQQALSEGGPSQRPRCKRWRTL
eukprot:COSAG01_NODE_40230_length_466_cov_0.893733_1_plen_148_part_01